MPFGPMPKLPPLPPRDPEDCVRLPAWRTEAGSIPCNLSSLRDELTHCMTVKQQQYEKTFLRGIRCSDYESQKQKAEAFIRLIEAKDVSAEAKRAGLKNMALTYCNVHHKEGARYFEILRLAYHQLKQGIVIDQELSDRKTAAVTPS